MTTSKYICEVSGCSDEKTAMYCAKCECLGEHDHHIVLELDEKCNGFSATFYFDCILSQYYYEPFKSLGKRIKTAYKALLNQPITVEGSFLFNKDGLKDYIKALQEGLKRLEKNEKQIADAPKPPPIMLISEDGKTKRQLKL